MAAVETIVVEVVHPLAPHRVLRRSVELPRGATAADALRASGIDVALALPPTDLQLGCWGRPCELGTVLRDRDRVELLRPLEVDPMEGRRRRLRRDGLRKPVRPARR